MNLIFIFIILIITTVYAHGGSYGGGEHGGGGYGGGSAGHGGGGYGGSGYGSGGPVGGGAVSSGTGGYGGRGPGGIGGSGHGSYGGGGHGNIGGHHHDFGHNGNDQFEIGHGHNSQEQVEIGKEELESNVNSGFKYNRVVTGSTYNQKPGGKVVVIETTRQLGSKPTQTVNYGSSWHQTGETVLTEGSEKHGKDEQVDIGFGNGQQEQVEIGQEELHSGSGNQRVITSSTYNQKPGGKVVVIGTTRQFGSKPTQTINTGSSWHQTGGTVLTEGSRKHGEDEQVDIGFGNGQQEEDEIGQEELHSGSGNQRVITSSTYNQKPGGKVVVIETTRQFSSKPTQTINTGSSWHQTGETVLTEGSGKHGKDEQVDIGFGNGQQEQVEIGQEELHSGSRNQKVITSSTYNQKPGGKVVDIKTTRQFSSKPTQTINTGSSWHQTGETVLTEGSAKHGKDEQVDIGFGNGQQEQVEIGQEELHSGSGNRRVVTGSTYNQKPSGKVVVIETTRQFGSKPTQTVKTGNSWHETSETFSSEGNTKHGKDEQIEIGQEQVGIGQEEQSDLLHSGSGNQKVITSSTHNQKPGGKVVVVETTRQFYSKPTQTVNVERSWHQTSGTILTEGNINSHKKDDQQEQVEFGQEQELEIKKRHEYSPSGYHTIVTDTTSTHKQNGQIVIESTREIESKPTLTSIHKTVEKHTSQGNVNDLSDELKQSLSKPDDKVVDYVQITRPTETINKNSHGQDLQTVQTTVTKQTTSYGKSEQFHNTKG